MFARRLRTLLTATAATTCVFGGCIAPSVVRAAISADAREIVARYVAATGGVVAQAAERTSYSRARIEGFGFKGRFEAWTARPERTASRTELGPFQLLEGSDGRSAWRTDPTTGRVVKQTGQELADALADAWFTLERWAEPDQGDGDVTFAGRERDSIATWSVLEVRPPQRIAGTIARARRLWFDDATGLLGRQTMRKDQNQYVTALTEWRESAGRLRPHVTESLMENMPANRLRATTDSVAVNLSVDGVAFGAPDSSGASKPVWRRADGVAVVPMDYRARHIWVKVAVNGEPPADFLFDTGASVTVLDSAWAERHGLATAGSMQAAGAGGAGHASFATVRTLDVGPARGDGVSFTNVKVAVVSVNPAFEPYFWREMAGVLGYDVISRFVTTVDYDHRTITLRDPATFTPDSTAGAPLPMTLAGTAPAIEFELDGRFRGLCRLDMGSSATIDFHSPFVARHGLDSLAVSGVEASGAGLGGSFASRLARFRSLATGPFRWDRPYVSLSRATEGAFASEDLAGNAGNRVLERFRITLDYERGRVWLAPSARCAQADRFNGAGLLIGRRDGKLVALSILAGSPAEAAGIEAGDEVRSIDGRPSRSWDPESVEKLFEESVPGTSVRFQVRRGAKSVNIRVRLNEML